MSNESGPSGLRAIPDLTVRLDPQVKANLEAKYDVNALERLLQRMPPQDRERLLGSLVGQTSSPETNKAQLGPGETAITKSDSPAEQHVRVAIKSSDPEAQALLDEVWAPYWRALPSGALDDPSYPYPGRELARARLKAGDRRSPQK